MAHAPIQALESQSDWAHSCSAIRHRTISLLGRGIGVAGLTIRLPIYGQRLAGLYEQVTIFLSAHGVEPTSLAVKNVLTPERLSEITVFLVPAAGAIFAKGALILLVAFLLIVEMLHGTEEETGLAR